MKKKRIAPYFIATLAAGFGAAFSHAQVQLMASAGSSSFLGDVGGSPTIASHDIRDLNLRSTRYMAGLGVKVELSENVALRLGGYYARVSGDDKYTVNPERKNRNLNFFAPITGGNLMVQCMLPNAGRSSHWYGLLGVEYFHFDPRTKYNGQTVRLQPLGTEGQYFLPGKTPYKLNSFAIPFGLGYVLHESSRSNISLELIMRKTFTDYMDDVSTQYADKTQLAAINGQMSADLSDRSLGDIPFFSDPGNIRGHSAHKDNFFFLSVTYSYKLGARKASDAGYYRTRHSYHPHRGNRRSNSCNGDF